VSGSFFSWFKNNRSFRERFSKSTSWTKSHRIIARLWNSLFFQHRNSNHRLTMNLMSMLMLIQYYS